MPLQRLEAPTTVQIGPMPAGIRLRNNELLDRSSGESRAVKDGVMCKPTGPLATPVPIIHASPRVTTMSTTRHTTYRSDRSVKLLGRVELIPQRGYSSTRAAIVATTRPTTSASDDQRRPDSAHVSGFVSKPNHRKQDSTRTSATLRYGLSRRRSTALVR